VTKILREAGSGPVVTAGSVVSGLERMFMGSSCYSCLSFRTVRQADRSGISKSISPREIPGSRLRRAPE
jgi:hypothetical protein